MLNENERRAIFNKEALQEALRLTSVENIAVINQCHQVMSSTDFEETLREMVITVYSKRLEKK